MKIKKKKKKMKNLNLDSVGLKASEKVD